MRCTRRVRFFLVILAYGLVAFLVWGRGEGVARAPHCVLVTALSPAGGNGPTNQYRGLGHVLRLRDLWGELEVTSPGRGQRVALRCASVRVALPRFVFGGDWKTANADVGLLLNVSVGRLGDRGPDAPAFVREDEALRALRPAGAGEGPRRLPVQMDCLVGRDYWDYLSAARRDADLLKRAAVSTSGRKLDLESDVHEHKFECARYLLADTAHLRIGGWARTWAALMSLWFRTRRWTPTAISEPGRDLVIFGVAYPLRLFYPIINAPYRGIPDRFTSHGLRFHPWLWDLSASALGKALAGKPAVPDRPPSLDAFATTVSSTSPNDGLANHGILLSSISALEALSACLSPAASGPPLPRFASVQVRLKDLPGGFCKFHRHLERLQPPQICGADLSRLPEVAGALDPGTRIVVATDGTPAERGTISLAFPGAVFLDPVLPPSCARAGPVAGILPGLIVQLALACADRAWTTPNSTFSALIGEMVEEGWCGRGRGEAHLLPGMPLLAP